LVLIALTGLLMLAGAAAFAVRHWTLPARRLAAEVGEARAGELPIERVGRDLPGGLWHLAEAVREALRESRRLEGHVARLEAEMRHRVERRTDALERQVGKLNAQATRDALSGLFNRRMLDQTLDDLIRRVTATHQPLCLLMIDVDDFKLLNDTLGHAAGDALIRSIGQLIRSSVREQDLAFRCGGDEFVIVMPEAGLSEGESLAKRVGGLVDALVKTLPLKRRPRLSIGISTLAGLGPNAGAATLMADADKRLYAIKAGRKKDRDPRGRAA
jgi:diguanylate cyclase (GGDEF)-like protein